MSKAGAFDALAGAPFPLILAVLGAIVALAGWEVRRRDDLAVRAGVPAAVFALLFGGFPYGSGHGGGGYAHVLWLIPQAPLTALAVFAAFFVPAFAACAVAAKLPRGWAGLGIAFAALLAGVAGLGAWAEREDQLRRAQERAQAETMMRDRNTREFAVEHGAARMADFVERVAPDHYVVGRPPVSDVEFRTAPLESGTLTFELQDGAFGEHDEIWLYDPVMSADLELRVEEGRRSGILSVAAGSSVLVVLKRARSIVEEPLTPDLVLTPAEPVPAPATTAAPRKP